MMLMISSSPGSQSMQSTAFLDEWYPTFKKYQVFFKKINYNFTLFYNRKDTGEY